MSSPDNHLILELWESAENAMKEAAVDLDIPINLIPINRFAKAAAVAVMRRLDAEIALAEEDDMIWPDAGDLLILAGELEASDV